MSEIVVTGKYEKSVVYDHPGIMHIFMEIMHEFIAIKERFDRIREDVGYEK